MLKSSKIVILGSRGVGKSSFKVQLESVVLPDERYPTIDTAATEYFRVMNDIKSVDGFVLLFSLTSSESFHEITKVANEIQSVKGNKDSPIAILVGNKSDLCEEREVLTEEAQSLANKLQFKYMETSIKQRIGVEELLFDLVHQIDKNINNNQSSSHDSKNPCIIM